MIDFRFGLLMLLFAGTIACSEPATKVPEADISSKVAAASPQKLPTTTLTPTPIRVNIKDLPLPYDSQSASKPPQVVPVPENPLLQVPLGFTVNVFAENLDGPRWLALTPSGDVLVTETPQNRIRLLRDSNGDGVADVTHIFADTENGLNLPFGMAFAGDYFFLGNTGEVRRFAYSQGMDKLVGTGDKITELPGQGYRQHWTRNVVVSPDGSKLYVSVGSRSNVDAEELPRASVQVMNVDGSNRATFAFGLRNPVGMDFHPTTGELYVTVNERDGLGDDLVPDYLTRLQSGEFFGWPFAYLAPNLLDPRHQVSGNSSAGELVKRTRTPDVLFQAHSAALGLQFYDGTTFPAKYRNGAFVAFRGSWNRQSGTGYKIVFVPFDASGAPQGYYEDFLSGFLVDPTKPATWGRPVGLLVSLDGSLLFTDEGNNRIYRIQYQGD
ncbi:MAG: sorbosone dehydrogenase family protein [Oscillatoriaceae cyanobacterium]